MDKSRFNFTGMINELMDLGELFSSTENSSKVVNDFVRTANLLVCTLGTLGNTLTKKFSKPKVLVIDEAGQVFEPCLVEPLAMGRSEDKKSTSLAHLIMIGEMLQRLKFSSLSNFTR